MFVKFSVMSQIVLAHFVNNIDYELNYSLYAGHPREKCFIFDIAALMRLHTKMPFVITHHIVARSADGLIC